MTPPSPAMSPRFTSVSPNFAVSAATIRSQASAISKPPPSAHPSTAAMSGLRTTAWVSPPNPRPGRIGVSPFANAFRSMPALNVPPAPVSTPTDNVGSASSTSRAACQLDRDLAADGVLLCRAVDGDRQNTVVTLGEHQLRRYFSCGHFAVSCSGATGITFCSRSWAMSSALNPSCARTSSLCSPCSGARREGTLASPRRVIGLLTV